MNHIAIAITGQGAMTADRLKIEAIRLDDTAKRLIERRASETGETFNDTLENTLIAAISEHFAKAQQ